MADLFSNPVSGIVDSVSKGVETVAGVFTTNKEKDAQRSADEQMALMQAYQAEFNQRQNRNWVDSLADGFNRLIRPFIVCLILFIFIIAYISPPRMAEITLAMSSIPDGYWTLLSVIIAFYFGGRMQLKSQQFKFNESQVQAVKALVETKKEFRKLEMDTDEPDKIIGDTIAKSPTIELSRTNKINTVIETALEHSQDQAKLADTISKLKSETPEATKRRRKIGPRKMFGQYR
jgi:hypothetical protein